MGTLLPRDKCVNQGSPGHDRLLRSLENGLTFVFLQCGLQTLMRNKVLFFFFHRCELSCHLYHKYCYRHQIHTEEVEDDPYYSKCVTWIKTTMKYSEDIKKFSKLVISMHVQMRMFICMFRNTHPVTKGIEHQEC